MKTLILLLSMIFILSCSNENPYNTYDDDVDTLEQNDTMTLSINDTDSTEKIVES